MRRLIGISILAMGIALSTSAHAEQWVRLNMDAPIFYGGGTPDIGGNNPISFVVNGDAAATSVNGRDLGDINIPVTVNGIDASYTVDVAGLPPGATWSGSAILWSPATEGTYTPTIEVRDAAGELVASQELELIIHLPLTASVPQTAYEVAVGDALTITPTAANAVGVLQWGSAPAELPDWLDFDAVTGVIEVDTATENALSNMVLTAVDQHDNDYASTQQFSVKVNGACDLWNARSAPSSNWHSIVHAEDKFVAVAYEGTNRVMTSSDGLTWTARAGTVSGWNSVTYGNGIFVAVANSGTYRAMASADGVSWVLATASESNWWRSVAYGNGLFVAVAETGTNRVMTSPDGITWTARAVEASGWRSVTYGDGLFVAVANSGTNKVMTSSDGITWTPRPAGASSNAWYGVTYGGGQFVAVAQAGTNRVMTSPDGITWTLRATPGAGSWYGVTHGNGMFVAVANTGTDLMMTSSDGINWALRSVPEANAWSAVAYGDGTFAAVAESGANRVMTSDCH